MAFVQEMESNNMRAKFVHNFVGTSYRNYNSNYSNGQGQNSNSLINRPITIIQII